MKLDVLHDTRLAFGRSVLVLQGGAIFGLCHLGVVKALHLQGLLPRIIAGTATGALIAALVCVHTEDELLDILTGDAINVKAFTNRRSRNGATQSRWYETLSRRIKRWWRVGHFLEVGVLEEVLRANIGDVTFEEAYEKTKRVLNITVTTSGGGGVPNLLNYITAPNVVCTLTQDRFHRLTYLDSSFGRPLLHRMRPRHPLSTIPLPFSAKMSTTTSCRGLLLHRPRSGPGRMPHTATASLHSIASVSSST
jgi:hypothetical protein